MSISLWRSTSVEIKIHGKELLVGDVIVDHRWRYEKDWTGQSSYWTIDRVEKDSNGYTSWYSDVHGLIHSEHCDEEAVLFRVRRVPSPPSVPKPDPRWNGKCVLCGRGVYQGFTSFEHEGGGCQ